ncbi:YqgE/AlgH family protein [Arsenicicoccus sp. oral taxon 190]|uniref:YqgE/AlgH family protein n=1 Tax=Arsenicicoccus sp. oral taxon 190 TaxID=1658671 RepID=UPI00067A25BF|nr:YqgE/AlgH family protein [Arsenicicoccus sp. oral taxon 190]AKT51471.1 hypothetical protein ADJ73_09335 [Arsenicicoccus sp. oral taxon 190]
MQTTDLTGRLLAATPAITEGVFERAVLLVLHHGEDGAQAVVLNKPVDATVDTVLDGWQEHVSAPSVLFQGGPVGLDSALGVVGLPGVPTEVRGVQRLFRGVGVVDLDTPAELVMSEASGVRIFAGYSGWSAGQLEAELREHTWYTLDLEPTDLFTDEPDTLWHRVLRRQPGRLALAAYYPDDEDYN